MPSRNKKNKNSPRRTQLATLCYVRYGAFTLMMHRVSKKNDVHEGKWNGLGGKFEPGESPDVCVRREVKEESGLVPRQIKLCGVLMFPEFTPKTDWMVFVYTAKVKSRRFRESVEGVLKWVPTASILKLNLWPGDRIFLKWLDRPDFFSGEFVYRNKKLIRHRVHFYKKS